MDPKTRMTLAQLAGRRKEEVRAELQREAELLRQNSNYTPAYKRELLRAQAAKAKAALAGADADVDRQVREIRADLAARRAEIAPKEDPTTILLREQQLGRHVATLRARAAAGALRAGELALMAAEARRSRDLAKLQAVEEILPELIAAAGKASLTTAGRGTALTEAETLRGLQAELPAFRDEFKSRAERELDAFTREVEAELSGAVRAANESRMADARDLVALQANEEYFAGETETQLAPLLAVNRARRWGQAAYRPVGESAERPLPDHTRWDEVMDQREDVR